MTTKFLLSLSVGLLLAGQAQAMLPTENTDPTILSEALVSDKSASCPFKGQSILTFDADKDSAGFLNTGTCSSRIYKAQVQQFQGMLEEISAASSMPVNPSVIRGINPQPIPPEGLAFIYTDLGDLVEKINLVRQNIDTILGDLGYRRTWWQKGLNYISWGAFYPNSQPKSFLRSDAPAAKSEVALVKQQVVTDANTSKTVKSNASDSIDYASTAEKFLVNNGNK
jgi:hypothetical protein